MKRTQIYLDEELIDILRIESKLRKKKISMLIREALREKYLTKDKKVIYIENAAGIWSDRDFDTDKYLRNLRKSKRTKDFCRK
ncbi:hypothetical protein BMS3Abin04_02537 [bacterium BMS3Abin04]|nr:hypothetical protein BMS3Abin04_02537 [bacterium BMS3Abin04]